MRPPLIAVVALVSAACGSVAVTPTTPPIVTATTTPVTTSPVTTTPIGDGEAPDGTPAAVDTVFDGDSMRVLIDGRPDEVRLLGINAPENGECYSDRSRDLLFGMVGETVVLVEDGRDQYDRILAYVYVGGTDVNAEMIRVGGALALTEDHPLFAEFRDLERTAVSDGLGMWNPSACGPASGASIVVAQVEARDEYVTLTNIGSEVDLGGWVLRDESSVHRYTFPAGFVLGAGASVTIATDCGTDTSTRLYWCADGPVWNNAGDTALLLDDNGDLVARRRY